jgi:hypothetical protein
VFVSGWTSTSKIVLQLKSFDLFFSLNYVLWDAFEIIIQVPCFHWPNLAFGLLRSDTVITFLLWNWKTTSETPDHWFFLNCFTHKLLITAIKPPDYMSLKNHNHKLCSSSCVDFKMLVLKDFKQYTTIMYYRLMEKWHHNFCFKKGSQLKFRESVREQVLGGRRMKVLFLWRSATCITKWFRHIDSGI